MIITFTRASSLIYSTLLFWFLQLVVIQELYAQGNNVTPTFNVNLTGDPNGTWTSEELTRRGQLCGAASNENCVQFNITLDKNSGGLEFVILSGPVPSGSMGYQLECGIQQPVGEPICVDGPGPHKLTLCMPGNAPGRFQIKSIAAFYPAADVSVTRGCTAVLKAPEAFRAATITWKDITASGKYDKYLSFPNGKANPVITPDADAPAFIDYQVCGTSQTSECTTLPYCDVLRVYLHPEPVVTIGPQPAIICPGANGVLLEGNVTGGNGSFNYIWTDNNGNQVATTKNYLATAPGTYHLEVRTENYPNCKKFSSSIAVINNLAVNAGPDQRVCSLNNVTLAGTVTGATGGIWSGGAGTFRAGNTALDNVYEPTPAELQQGFVKLTLTSTGNGSCSAVKDEILITFYSVEVNITGPAIICAGSTASLTAQVTGADNLTYAWNTGETTATITGKPAGTYTVTIRDGNSCTVTKSFTITAKAGPSFLGVTLKASTCGASNGELKITDVAGGTMPYTYSKDGTIFQSTTAFTELSAGDYAITVKDANGCTFVRSFTLTNIAGPTAITATAQAASCKNNDGTLTVGTVTGGTAPYTYAITGSGFQTSTAFTGLATGTFTVTAKDANGCTVTTTVAVGMNIPTSFTSSTTATTCGSNNGQLTVTGVIGGTAPYTYSKDGTTFHTATTFTSLIVGTYTITIKDANGCIISGTVPVNNIAGPSGLAASVKATTCGNSNGELNVTSTTGGTAPYTYSLNGASFQSQANYTGLAAGTYQVRVKDANNCIYTEEVVVPNIAGPAFTLNSQSTTCGNSNGSIAIGTVTGGTAPFTYSKDGTNFQSGTAFTALAAGEYTITTKDANGCLATKTITLNNIAGPTNVNLTAAASTCGSSNGIITAGAVTGGTAPYTYSKDGTTFQAGTSFTSLLAGEYTITVKDANGCLTSKKVMVSDVAGPTDLAASPKASTCGSSNGELTITSVTGGTAPYSYSKDGTTFQASASFNALAAGNYTITVKDANGCTFVKTFTLNNIAGPSAVTASAQPATCADNNGTVTAGVVIGGTAPYTYAINGSSFQTSTIFTGVASGNYTLTAKDANGCTATTLVSVSKNMPTGFTSSTTASTCSSSNGQLTITGITGGTAPYTYSKDGATFQASASFSGLLAGTYTITVKDANGCTFAAPVQINNIPGPSDLAASVKASTCSSNNGQVTISGVTGGTAPYSYAIDNTAFQSVNNFPGLLAGTYIFKVKDANGCVYTEEVTINNIPGSTFTATVQASTCGNSNGSIAISNVLGGTAHYAYSKDGTNFQATTTFNGLAAGSYTITIKDANGCLSTQAVTLNNIAGPTALTLTSTASTCGGYNGKLEITGVTGGTAPYTYAINNNFQSETIFENVPAGAYTVTAKDANGCILTQKAVVNDIAGPTDLAASLTASTCGASNGALTLTGVTGGTAPYTYSKDKINFQSSATFPALTAGQHAITVKDTNGCTFMKTFTINNIAGPTAVIAAAQPATCANNDGTVTVGTVTGGTAPYIFAINNGSFQTGVTFTGMASGTYTLTTKDANGCTITTAVSVGKNIPTGFTSTSTASTCGSSNGGFTITGVSGGTAPYTYSLTGGNFSPTATFTSLAAGTHQVHVKDANNCTYTGTVQVSNIAGPTFTTTMQATTCGNSNGRISINQVTGGTAPYTYSKDGTNFQASLTFDGLKAGEHTVVIKDANGCLSSKTVQVQDIAGPSSFALTLTSTTCGNRNGSIAIGTVTGGTAPYTYALDNATFQSTATFNAVAAGEHTLTVRDANGCTVVKQVTIENIAGPKNLTASAVSSTCGSSNGKLEMTGVTGGTAPYLFSRNGGNYQSAPTFTDLVAGLHTITVKDANGCTYTESYTISNIAGPTAVAATALAATCTDNDGSITATEVTGGTAPYQYSIDGIYFKSAVLFGGLASGTYTLLAKDANGCLISQTVNVEKVTPTQFSSTTESSTCGGNDGSITITGVTGGTAPYIYSLDGTTFQSNNTFTALIAGAHAVTVKDANGCTYTGQVQVNNTGGPADLVAAVKSTTCGNRNGEINITRVSGGTAPYTYSLDGLTFGSIATFSGLVAGKYQVSVQDANDCRYTEEVVIVDLAAPTFTATAQNSTCGHSNASITISNITGGTAPFSFSRDGLNFQSDLTFSGLAAGDYTITAKDANGCLRTVSVDIQNIAGPTGFTLAATSSTCGTNNGHIKVSAVVGGTYPYTYAIDGVNFQTAPVFETVLAGEYTVTVKDVNGCMVTKKIRVDDIAGPSGLIASLKSTTCGNSNGELTITGVTGGTSPYLYSKDGVTYQAAATFGALVAGEYAITVKDANGCTFVKTFILNNLAGPTALAINFQAASCADNDGSISISNVTGGTAPYTYAINGQDYQASATFSALASGNYTLTVKDANGCTVSAPVKVEKNIPAGFTSNTTATTCGKNNGQFTITAVNGGTAPYTYSLDGTTYQQAATFTALAPGEYQVRIKDAKGCLFTGKVEINSIAAPAFTATAQTATCSNNNGRISISQVTGGTAPYSYSLDGTNYQAATSFSNLVAGTYAIILRDANNCTYAVSVKVENIPGPTDFSLTATTATCGNHNGRINFGRVTGGTAPYSYAIQSSTLNANPFQSSPDFAGVAAGTYTATVKDANGCILQKQVEVGNTAGLANLRATATPSACSSNTGSIIVEAVNGGTTPYTYSVDGVNYQASAYFAALAPKTYTVYVKDATGCSTSANVTVSTNGPQEATLAANPTTCATNSGMLTITAVTGGTQPYTYSINGNTFQTSAQLTNLAAGSYTVTIRDAGGCTLTRTQAVGTTGGANAFTIATTAANCSGTNGQLIIGNISGGSSPYTYSINGTTFQNSTLFNNLATGDYRVSVKDAGGCVYTQNATITGSQPLVISQISVTPVGCSQNSGQVSVQNVSGGASPYTYSLDGVNFSASATFNGVQPGKYTLTVKDASNCSITAAVEVTRVSSSLAQVKDVSCFGAADGEIAIAATGVTDETAYSIDNGVSFHKKAVFSNLTKGIYQVITRFSATCTITIGQVEIKGPEEIRATVIPLTKTTGQENNGSAAVTEVAGGAKPYSYQLDNGSFTPNTEFKNLSSGTHTLLVKDANGCTTSVAFTIETTTGAIAELEIPNGFTPNGDGINDTWAIKNLSLLYPRCKVSVYNRWGNLVFESVGYSWEWDGTYNTQKLPVGTYYYTLKLDDTKPVLRKSVTIMR